MSDGEQHSPSKDQNYDVAGEKAAAILSNDGSQDEFEASLAVSEQRLLRKLDFKLLPALTLLYLLSFLDRSNGKGSRRICRCIPTDSSQLAMPVWSTWPRLFIWVCLRSRSVRTEWLMYVTAGNQYLTGLTFYFIGYVLFEVKSYPNIEPQCNILKSLDSM